MIPTIIVHNWEVHKELFVECDGKMLDFSVEVEILDRGVALLCVKGPIDVRTVSEFDRSMQGLFKSSTYKISIDLSNVDYISCAGVGVFVGALFVVRQYGGEIVLVGLKENTREIFKLLSIDRLFNVADDTNEAWKILGEEILSNSAEPFQNPW